MWRRERGWRNRCDESFSGVTDQAGLRRSAWASPVTIGNVDPSCLADSYHEMIRFLMAYITISAML